MSSQTCKRSSSAAKGIFAQSWCRAGGWQPRPAATANAVAAKATTALPSSPAAASLAFKEGLAPHAYGDHTELLAQRSRFEVSPDMADLMHQVEEEQRASDRWARPRIPESWEGGDNRQLAPWERRLVQGRPPAGWQGQAVGEPLPEPYWPAGDERPYRDPSVNHLPTRAVTHQL